jgi:hypothetical protein
VAIDLSSDSEEDAFQDISLEVRTDKDGNWSFPYLPRMDSVYVSASSPDGISQEDLDLELVADKWDYEVDLVMEMDLNEPPVLVPPQPGAPRK